MANKKITDLTELITPDSGDYFPIVDISDPTQSPTGTTKKIKRSTFSATRSATLVVAASNSKDTTNADYICTGTNDQITINAAIAALPSGSGKIILLDGLYNITGSINCGGGGGTSAVVIEGQGWNTQLKLANAANVYLFDLGLNNAPQFTIGLALRDMYLNCNGGNQTAGGGIYARGAVWCEFQHLFIQTPYEAGIRFYQDGTGSYSHHNSILDCLFRDGKNSNGGQGWAIKFEQADENHVSGCTFQDNGYPVGAGHDGQIYDTQAGLQSIVNCSFVGGGAGVPFVFSDSGPGRISFANNQFDSPNGGADCLILNGDGHQVIGNTFLGIGGGTGSNHAGVHTGGTSKITIKGNAFYSSGSRAVAVTEDANATGNIIEGNVLSGTWAAGPIITATSSTTRVSNNIGATNKTESIGATVTVAASNAAFPNDANYICTGTNDDVTIQSAINALPAGGGKVMLSDGTFNISATINITNKYVTLQGQGAGTYLKAKNGLNNYMISASGGLGEIEGVMIQDLYLDGNSSNQTSGSCIYFANTTQSYIKHVKIINVFNYCVVFDKLNGQDNYNNWVTECEFSHAGAFINEVASETNIYMNNYMFGAVGFAGGAHPLSINGGGATIINNQFGGNSNATNQSAYIRGGNTNPIKIIGNMFNNSSKQAIQLLSGGHSVIGNTFIGIGQLTPGTYNAIEIWDSNNIVEGNVFTAFTNYQLKDIAEQNNSGNGNTITNNTIATGITLQNPYTKVLNNPGLADITPIVAKIANYTLTVKDVAIVASGSGTTITLPTAVGITGTKYTIKRVDGTNAITVATTSSQTIDGSTTVSLSSNYMAITVQSDGANWQVINQVATTIL